MVNIRITKIALNNKENMNSFFIEGDSIFSIQKVSLEGLYKTKQ
ncbi:hypothetical protein C8P70_14310 [Myroides indicus]|uniref:Uncharacterized protein n=1 Tax=Myroides indicus TaxID=1323422 RepID=A0A4R7EUK8_9FLAO|nr:hypothetical protein C8P70_14310 [Myroides indicus]